MRYRLDLVLTPAEGVLTRVIGMVERRGFTPSSISGQPGAEDGHWRLQMEVEGARPADSLRLQMLKLYDCVSVDIAALDAAAEVGG